MSLEEKRRIYTLERKVMRCEMNNIMKKNIFALFLFIILAYVISNNKFSPFPLFEFHSPFCPGTPSQLVFLACIVTSTVALTVIGNRFRDRMDEIEKEKLEIEEKQIKQNVYVKELNDKFNERITNINKSFKKCQIGLFQMTIVLSVQVIMACITCLRILFTWEILDIYLIWGSFYLFGILWVHYFFVYGGGEHLWIIFKNDNA
ncbi:hypothetical protein [Methylomicrobium lacus]|uniref:hypothetical protein n=1 Tax=Methylomicrobium lacus TaxID=136992 RepID=UPI00045E6693|nr:hypothetical protein [Methylomicrobium lacus]